MKCGCAFISCGKFLRPFGATWVREKATTGAAKHNARAFCFAPPVATFRGPIRGQYIYEITADLLRIATVDLFNDA